MNLVRYLALILRTTWPGSVGGKPVYLGCLVYPFPLLSGIKITDWVKLIRT
jgi:hypothetical protein